MKSVEAQIASKHGTASSSQLAPLYILNIIVVNIRKTLPEALFLFKTFHTYMCSVLLRRETKSAARPETIRTGLVFGDLRQVKYEPR